ncbi:prepilin-type N-terminal cleavage/methylation domain-containing protein [Pelomonas aquatica]|uniref:Prepilin-type N-terminal cleavage/methylation domain-containing protein n=2 Tax=Pelomonas aquatica TaxID=431058 RepID=A0A9X4LLC8_9BURK|nr:prepilin-type N-terminal cleavage/methylation domain-containing protein [Pelomonas aquatica]MDG0864662.1 prepilin-type N-terminal cleavage/methylation domain-containing protein [Pelomonas aquatica]
MLGALIMQQLRTPLHPTTSCRGLTLVEVLVALVVLGVIVALASPSLADMMERRRVVAAMGELTSMINFAKSETNAVGDVLDLHLEPSVDSQISCARLVTQSVFDTCGCDVASAKVCRNGSSAMVREFLLPKSTGVSFLATADSWPAGNALSFTRNLHYATPQNFRLTVTGQRTGAQLRIQLNDMGRVHVCSPSASIGGYPAC